MTLARLIVLPLVILATTPLLAHGPDEHVKHGDHQAATYGEPGDANAPARTVEIAMREGDGKMLFKPDEVIVSRGEQIRFHLNNEGELDHEFVLGTPEEIDEHAEMMRTMPEMKHDDPNSKRLGPKATADIVWKFTTAGTFDFACLIPGHREAGMTGKITVK